MKPVHLLVDDPDALVKLVQHLKFGQPDRSSPDFTIVYPDARPTWFIQGLPDAGHQPVYTTVDGDGVCSDQILQVFLDILIVHGLPFATVTGSGDQVCRIIWSKTADITGQGSFISEPASSGDQLHQHIVRWGRRSLPDWIRGIKLPFDFCDSSLIGLPYHGDLPATVELTEGDDASVARVRSAMSDRLNEAKPFITRFRRDRETFLYLWA